MVNHSVGLGSGERVSWGQSIGLFWGGPMGRPTGEPLS